MRYTLWASSAPSWQCPRLLDLRAQEEKGEPYELSVEGTKNLLRSLSHYLAQRLGPGQGNLAGFFCLDPCGF